MYVLKDGTLYVLKEKFFEKTFFQLNGCFLKYCGLCYRFLTFVAMLFFSQNEVFITNYAKYMKIMVDLVFLFKNFLKFFRQQFSFILCSINC